MAVKARAEITLSSIRDVQSVTRYYLLQSSTSAVPSKPTTNPPGGNWVTAEPTYTSGSTNSLYFVDLTVFSDGTFAYSDVSLSSSYEAAKVAYNKAAGAADVANSANEKIDNLQIGGRNLWKNTGTPSIVTARNTGGAADNYNYATIPYVNSINLKQRDAYTISGFVSFTSVDESQYPIPTRMSVYLSYRPTYLYETFPINTDGSFSYTFTIQTNTEGANQSLLYAGIAGSTRGIGATFSKLKLERGTLATDWTPAPEDVAADISAANALAQSAKDTADGKITTFYAASSATPTATTVGDLWIKTDDGNSLWRWNGTSWVSVDNADIQSALTAAGTAQSTADSKVVTFAQASTPTATDIGDIWIDTDDSNRMYRWNGTAWVDVHDPQIAEANEKIDNLQIGGRNLLLNSEHFIPDSGIFSGSNANLYTNATFDGEGLYYASGSKYVKVTFPNLTIGEQYAFSCEVARPSGGSSIPVYITINGEEAVEVGTAKALTWTKFNVIFTASASTTYAKVQVYTAVSSANAGWVGHFRHFKLERGNRATDWTPAPEDVIEAGISAANEAVDGLQIGGRNLIKNTLYPSTTAAKRPCLIGQIGSTNGRGTASVAEHGIRFTNTNANWQYIHFGISSNSAAVDMLGLEPGETYTFSADLSWKVLSSATGTANATTYYMGATLHYSTVESGAFSALNGIDQFPITQADKGTDMSGRLVYTFTVPTTAKRLYLGIRCSQTTASHYAKGDYIEARNLKLEKGTKVTDWTPAPEDLENAITTSQETADGKNTVYYQNSAPTNQTFKINDIWFDTDDENKMYHWNGSAWTAAPFGNAAFSNIDAGKVTTGTMSANRIKGDILTLGGANNVDGMLKVYDANGTLVGSFTREGLMAIAGTIGGWNIGDEDLTGEWDVGTEHWMVGLSKSYGLRFKEVPQGGDPATDWTREVQYNAGLASYSSKENGETYHGAVENYPGEDGLRIYPKLIIGDHSASTVTEIATNQIDTTKVRLTELWAHPLGYGDSFYMQQPLMIMAGSTTISTGTSSKRATICAIPVEYQTGWRIIPFVTRTYGNPGATPADAGDFYYAYYNCVDHNVCIKLANVLTSGIPYVFDYMIYAVPES